MCVYMQNSCREWFWCAKWKCLIWHCDCTIYKHIVRDTDCRQLLPSDTHLRRQQKKKKNDEANDWQPNNDNHKKKATCPLSNTNDGTRRRTASKYNSITVRRHNTKKKSYRKTSPFWILCQCAPNSRFFICSSEIHIPSSVTHQPRRFQFIHILTRKMYYVVILRVTRGAAVEKKNTFSLSPAFSRFDQIANAHTQKWNELFARELCHNTWAPQPAAS